MLRFSLLLAPALLVPEAVAQGLLVCRHSPARIEHYSATDGSLIDDTFVDVDALLGLGGATTNIWDVTRSPTGQIWISNYTSLVVQRFSPSGQNYIASLPIASGNATGLSLDGTNLAIASVGGPGVGVRSYDTVSMTETQLSTASGSWDVTVRGSEWLVSRMNGNVVSMNPNTGVETLWSSPGGFCEQIITRPSGEVIVANFGLQGYTIHNAAGTVLQSYSPAGVGGVRGVAQLGNGNVMLSSFTGLFIFNPNTNVVTMVDSGPGAFIYHDATLTGGSVGTPYCSANNNSSGLMGSLSASGSPLVASNDITLEASQIPPSSFGFFIVSQSQGFVQNPGGSAGNLCLSGAVGRYVGPGQVQQSNSQGMFALSIDLTSIPQPMGPVSAQPGDTWSFQVWHRDSAGGQPTSNFTTGLEIVFQ